MDKVILFDFALATFPEFTSGLEQRSHSSASSIGLEQTPFASFLTG